MLHPNLTPKLTKRFKQSRHTKPGTGGVGKGSKRARLFTDSAQVLLFAHGIDGIPTTSQTRTSKLTLTTSQQYHELQERHGQTTEPSLFRTWKTSVEQNRNQSAKVPTVAVPKLVRLLAQKRSISSSDSRHHSSGPISLRRDLGIFLDLHFAPRVTARQ